ncbi:MAG: galactose oxidase [Candidatus Rokuibacteriota bacterium]|nr:MAG: galactose oxidase [Candidatus Rokubacteria bacterium]
MRFGRPLGALITVGLIILVGCLGKTTDSPAPIDILSPGKWTSLAPMPTARQEVAVAELNGRVFVIGGFGSGGEAVPTVEVYDPASDRWETRSPLPAATHHAAAAVVGGRLYVVGGYTGGRTSWTPLRTVYEYDEARSSWSTRAPLRVPRGGLAMVTLGNRLHAVGGSADRATGAHETYDPASDRWTDAPPMPTARDHLAAVVFEGRLWAIGGRTSFVGTQYEIVEIYDPATDAWSTGPPLPVGRGGLAAAALGDRVYVFGGEAPLRIFSATEMYEVAGKRWIAKDPMRTPRHGIGAAVVGNRIYVPGGSTQPGYAATDANEVYTP